MAKEQKEKQFMTWQLLRKGNYYNGQITDDMLQEIKETFANNGDIPIGIGHINYFFDDSLPAEGWIDVKKEFGIDSKGNFTTKGVNLYEPLASLYAEGRYKNWSVVMVRPRTYNQKKDSYDYGKWEIRGVDMLGRANPAIKNLKDLTANSRQADLSKFTIDEKDANVLKFNESGVEMEFRCFSFTDNIEQTDNDEDNEMNEHEKKLAEISAKLEEQQKQFADKESAHNEEVRRLSEENKAIKENALKKIAENEKKTLSEALEMVPQEMREKLFSAIDSAIPLSSFEMSFGENEEKKSLFGLFAEAIKHVRKTDEGSYFSDVPNLDGNEENRNVYKDGYKMTKKMFGQ